jgi:hypothetical protein
MFGNYNRRAEDLQRAVKYGEIENLGNGVDDYSDNQVRQSSVHTRQDLVLIVSHIASLNEQVATIRRLAWIVAAIAAWVAWHLR